MEEPVTLLLTRLTSLTSYRQLWVEVRRQNVILLCKMLFVILGGKLYSSVEQQRALQFQGLNRGWKFIPSYTLASVFGVASLRLGWLKGNFLLPSHQDP